MLGLRLDEPLHLAGAGHGPDQFLDQFLDQVLDTAELERLEQHGLVVRGEGTLTLTRRGRFLGGGVTARLLA
jgi:coproporphyrinogen III oxidase-like Fe-S oxidoreductase